MASDRCHNVPTLPSGCSSDNPCPPAEQTNCSDTITAEPRHDDTSCDELTTYLLQMDDTESKLFDCLGSIGDLQAFKERPARTDVYGLR